MKYFYQDILYVSLSVVLLLVLVIHMLARRRFPKGSPLLLGLMLLLSTAGLSDIAFRFNPRPDIVLLADSLNVFCFSFALAIILHFSLAYFSPNQRLTRTKLYLLLYAPALVISGLHALSPLTIHGIISGPIGFQLSYNWGYWIIVAYGVLFGLYSLFLNVDMIFIKKDPAEKNRAAFLVFVLLLIAYFYQSSLIFPFLFRMVNFASPLPTTCAVLVLAYAYIKYRYFTLETIPASSSSH